MCVCVYCVVCMYVLTLTYRFLKYKTHVKGHTISSTIFCPFSYLKLYCLYIACI